MMIVTAGRSSGSIAFLLYASHDPPGAGHEDGLTTAAGSNTIVSDDGTEGNGLGVLLPIVLGASLLAALAIGLARRRASAASG
jgi:hypothetical protein